MLFYNMSFTEVNQDSNTGTNNQGNTVLFGQSWTVGTQFDAGADGFDNNSVTMGTLTGDGVLVEIIVRIRTDGTSYVPSISVYDGELGLGITSLPTPLSTVVSGDTVDGTLKDISFSFVGAGLTLTNGQQYSFLIDISGGSSSSFFERASGNPYSGGFILRFPSGGPMEHNTSEDFVFRINVKQSVGAGADPLITPLSGPNYYLPNDTRSYCMIDTQDPIARFIVNIKCHMRKNGKSYIRYVYLFMNGDELVVRLPCMCVMEKGENFNELANQNKLAYSSKKKVNSTFFSQSHKSSKVREVQVKTGKYGTITMSFAKNKFNLGFTGPVGNLLTDKSVGCLTGNIMAIPNFDYKAKLVL